MEIICKNCNASHFLSDDKIPLETKTGKCKQCSAPITVLGKNATVSIEPTPIQSTPPEQEATKNCDFCGEKILAIAKKCRYCSSMMDGSNVANSQVVVKPPSVENQSSSKITVKKILIMFSFVTFLGFLFYYGHIETLIASGNILTDEEDYNGAIKKYQKAIELNPKNAEAYFYLAEALLKKRDIDKALETYKKAIELEPKNSDYISKLGFIFYVFKNDYQAAIEQYKKAMELNPKNATSYYYWGIVLSENSNYDAAIEKYKKAIELEPNEALYHYHYGIALYKNGDKDGAIEKYQKAIKLNSKYDNAYYEWGVALYSKGDCKNARIKFDKAIELGIQSSILTRTEKEFLARCQPTSTSTNDWQMISRYQVKNGLVKDTVTGLMWMRCSLGQTWADSICQGVADEFRWDDAIKVANEFNYQGYKDWRIPTNEELSSLVYCSSGQPKLWNDALDSCSGNYNKPTIFSAVFPNTPSEPFLTSSLNISDSNEKWIISFINGYAVSIPKTNGFNIVRLVRVE